MKAIVCELCGGNQIRKENDVFVCQNCGTQYTTEEAKKLMVEVSGKVDVSGSSVKVDKQQEYDNYINIANKAKNVEDYSKAAAYYNKAYEINPDNWDIGFYSVYYECIDFTGDNLVHTCRNLNGGIKTALHTIKDTLTDTSMIKDAIGNIKDDICELTEQYYSYLFSEFSAVDNIRLISREDQIRQNSSRKVLAEQGCEVSKVLFNFGDEIIHLWGDEYVEELVLPVWKSAIDNCNIIGRLYVKNEKMIQLKNTYIDKLSQYDADEDYSDADSVDVKKIIIASLIVVLIGIVPLIFVISMLAGK